MKLEVNYKNYRNNIIFFTKNVLYFKLERYFVVPKVS